MVYEFESRRGYQHSNKNNKDKLNSITNLIVGLIDFLDSYDNRENTLTISLSLLIPIKIYFIKTIQCLQMWKCFLTYL